MIDYKKLFFNFALNRGNFTETEILKFIDLEFDELKTFEDNLINLKVFVGKHLKEFRGLKYVV
jgi:hypothetical protein